MSQCLGPNGFSWITWKSWSTWSNGMLNGFVDSQFQIRIQNTFQTGLCSLRALLVSQVQLVSQEKKVHLVFEEITDHLGVMEREVNLVLLEVLETREILEKMDHQ